MKDLNQVIIVGRLTKDPEKKMIKFGDDSRPVCNFSIAVNREKDKDAFFFNVECWGKLADECMKMIQNPSKGWPSPENTRSVLIAVAAATYLEGKNIAGVKT